MTKLTPRVLWADAAPYITASDWLTLQQLMQRSRLNLGRAKQAIASGIYLGLVEYETQHVSKPPHTHWKQRRYRLKGNK